MTAPESFRTARLEGKRLVAEYLHELRALHADARVMAELGGVRDDAETSRYLERNLAHWERHGFGVWMLRLEGGEQTIGRVLLRWLTTEDLRDVEIGFALLPAHQGQGLATEAGRHCIGVAREQLGLDTLVGITTPGNAASQHVLEKLGFRYERDTVVEGTRCRQFRVSW